MCHQRVRPAMLDWRRKPPAQRNADHLPSEGYGFDDDNDDDDDDDRDHYDNRTKTGNIPSTSGAFYFIFHEADNESEYCRLIYGEMYHGTTTEKVGVLSADLVKRSKRGLYSVCDERSDELLQWARFACKDNGTLKPAIRNAIGDAARVKAANKGGLLFLDELHILRSHRGTDLMFEFLDGLFGYLGVRWTLAVATIVPYDFCDSRLALGFDNEPAKRTDAERIRLCRHFARIPLCAGD